MDSPVMIDTPLSADTYQEAIDTPLPDSPRFPQSFDAISTESDYASTIHFLSSFMPHLRKVAMPIGIHNHANIDLYDYTAHGLKTTGRHNFSMDPEILQPSGAESWEIYQLTLDFD